MDRRRVTREFNLEAVRKLPGQVDTAKGELLASN
jgi:hypothetical protein